MAAMPSSAAAPVSAGSVYAFGSNAWGELGNTTITGTNPTPTVVSLPAATGPVTNIASGAYHSLVVTSTGQLFAFGENFAGELGSTTNNGTTTANPTPTPVNLPGATGPVIEASAGNAYSLAVTTTGQLYAFGGNFYGQLGTATNSGTSNPNPTPVLVDLPGATGGVVQASAGFLHSLALTSTGQLYAFGHNTYGELGVTTNVGTATANPTPALVSLPGATGPVVQIAAGSVHSLALTSTGQLYGFGDNSAGELGSTVNNGTSTPNPTPALITLPGATGPIVKISAGGSHSLALTSTGQLYAFGSNYYGQLGTALNNGTFTANPTPTPVTLPGATGPVVQIAAGPSHSLAVTSTGQLYAFGYNTDGELGTATNSGTNTPSPTPILVGFPAGVTIDAVAPGSEAEHTLAIVANLAVSSTSLPGGQVGVPYSASGQASGGTGPYTWAASGLPAGLTINPSTGAITGTPAAPATANAVLSVTDAYGITATSAPLPLTIAAARALTTTKAPTVAQLKAGLLAQLAPKGKAAKIAALLKKKAYTATFKALEAGAVVIDWYYLPKGAHLTGTKIKPVLIAQGKKTLKAAGTSSFTIKLSTKGKRLLANAMRLKMTAQGFFTPRGAAAVSTTRTLTLIR